MQSDAQDDERGPSTSGSGAEVGHMQVPDIDEIATDGELTPEQWEALERATAPDGADHTADPATEISSVAVAPAATSETSLPVMESECADELVESERADEMVESEFGVSELVESVPVEESESGADELVEESVPVEESESGADELVEESVPVESGLEVAPEISLEELVADQSVEPRPEVESVPVEESESGADESSPVSMPLPRVIAVANQKGGVGKTTTTVNIAACLAEEGYRTLLVDLDPQANASTGVGLEPYELERSIYHVMLHDQAVDTCIEPTDIKNLFILPSTLDLAGAEIELVSLLSREHRLRLAIESVLDDFDYVLIDCPPSLGLLTINALTAAREVLVPIQCEYYALEGLGQLIRNVDLIRASLNPDLLISHIVLVMFDPRTKLAGQVVDEVRAHFGAIVCKNVIPRTVRLSEAPSFGQPITTFDSGSRGAAAYRAVTQEVLGGQA